MTWSVIELPTSDIDVVILVKQEFDNKQLEIFYVVVCIILHNILVMYTFLLNFYNNGVHH